MDNERISIKVSGESGQGINTIGELLADSIKAAGYKLFGYREYPSLIRGGYASYQIDFSDSDLRASSKSCDVLLSLSRVSLHKYLKDLHIGGTLIHPFAKLEFSDEEVKFIKDNDIDVVYVDAFTISEEIGGTKIFANIILAGVTWKLLGFSAVEMQGAINKKFGTSPKYLPLDLKAFEAGFGFDPGDVKAFKIDFKKEKGWSDSAILTGNAGIVLGSVAAGTRIYYGYPMTPSSSILSYHADFYKETGVIVKQAEDEITAIQMAIGSMFMGTRALVATSGGGFDLMTESISLAGMTETPVVCLIGQRPGPATGLPTWTSAGDLNLAVYAGHGEFPRCVIAASDIESAYLSVQHAFNIAEKYQIPVLLLTDKQIAEALYNIKEFPESVEIERHLVHESSLAKLQASDRYKITHSGLSDRWLPGSAEATFVGNSDEHLEDGSLTEEAAESQAMMEKRMRKLETLQNEIPEPEFFGDEDADVIFVGWGSVKGAILDTKELLDKVNSKIKIGYLHFEYIYPLKIESFKNIAKKAKRLVLIENNSLGQLGNLITQNTSYSFKDRLLKYDGRPFFIEDILDYLKTL